MTENRMPWEDAANDQQKTEVTIKFGKGLVGEPFTTKNGKEVVEVKIPNREGDTRPWESFIISPKMIHDNQFGKGVWMKLPEDGTTNLLTNTASARGHQVINQQNEDGNASVEATHFSEEVAEGTVKTAQHAKYSHKLKQYKKLEKLEHRADKEAVDQMLKEKMASDPSSGTNLFSRWRQRQAIKKEYAAAKAGRTGAGATAEGAKKATKEASKITDRALEFVKSHSHTILIIAAIGLLVMVISGMFCIWKKHIRWGRI